jgi:hypothetical protein
MRECMLERLSVPDRVAEDREKLSKYFGICGQVDIQMAFRRLTPEFSCKHSITVAAKPHPKSACQLQRSLGGSVTMYACGTWRLISNKPLNNYDRGANQTSEKGDVATDAPKTFGHRLLEHAKSESLGEPFVLNVKTGVDNPAG